MDPRGIQWEWEAWTKFMGMGTGMVDRNWEENEREMGIVV